MTRIRRMIVTAAFAAVVAAGTVAGVAVSQSGGSKPATSTRQSNEPLYANCTVTNVAKAAAWLGPNPTQQQWAELCKKFGKK